MFGERLRDPARELQQHRRLGPSGILQRNEDPQQKALAIQISQAVNAVNGWYQTVRADILQLYAMSDAQLLGSQGRPLLDEVATLANDAFVGQINSQGQVINGVVQIHYAIQRLATFDIKACVASSPCPSLT